MVIVADRVLRSAGGSTRRLPRLAPEHAALIAVAAAYCVLVVLRTPQLMSLTFDEVVYASQLSADTPPARWSAPRARGMALLVAPIVAITEWVLILRVYLTVLSGLLMYVAFRPWLAVFRMVGGRYRFLPAVAAGFFATLWLTVLYGNLSYPNLWLTFAIVAGAGCFFRAVGEPQPGWGPTVGVAVAFAAAALIRPTDALAAAVPLMVAPLLVLRWIRFPPVAAIVGGLLVGWSAWVVEAYTRFDGPVERLRSGSETNAGGFVNTVPEHFDAFDGPSVLCRPHDICQGIEPAAAAWWLLLPVVVTVGLFAAQRSRWFAVGAVATASAVALTVSYFFLIDYAAARFLLPTYGLLAIPVAGALLWMIGLGVRLSRPLTAISAVVLIVLHIFVQQQMFGPIKDRQESIANEYTRLAEFLRDKQGVQAPCLVWGEGVVQLGYLLKCRSVWEQGGDPPSENDPAIAAAVADGDDVVVRIRADAEPPASMAGWRRVSLPGSDYYVAYLPPDDR